MEVAPGLFQLKVPIPDNPLGYLNAYLVKGDGQCLLVDTGWNTDEALESLRQQLADIGLGYEDITQIVITHIHPDHFGLAGRLKKLTNAELIYHEVEKAFVDSRYVHFDDLLDEMAQWLRINGVPDTERTKLQRASLPVKDLVSVAWPDRSVHGGEKLAVGEYEFEVIWTPGHSPGHICLYDAKKRVFISGDHVLPVITPNVSLHAQSLSNPLADYVDALKAIENLPVDLVLPAHEHIFHDLKKRATEIHHHHEERKNAILDAIGSETRTAYDVAGMIPWNMPGVTWETMPFFDKRSAVTETLAHLELLRLEGRVEKVLTNGIAYYQQASEPE